MTTVLALDAESYIGSKFKGPRVLREEGRFEATLPTPTAFDEWLQTEMLANGPLEPVEI